MDDFDVLFTRGCVYDGAGGPWYRADIGIRDDTIARVGPLQQADAGLVVDCRNLAVSPGFIDTSTYEEPRRHPKGIRHVFVNGTQVVREGEILDARAGRVLRR